MFYTNVYWTQILLLTHPKYEGFGFPLGLLHGGKGHTGGILETTCDKNIEYLLFIQGKFLENYIYNIGEIVLGNLFLKNHAI